MVILYHYLPKSSCHSLLLPSYHYHRLSRQTDVQANNHSTQCDNLCHIPDPDPDSDTDPLPDPGIEPDPDPGIDPDPDPGIEPDPDPGIEPLPDPGIDPDPDPGIEPDPEPSPGPIIPVSTQAHAGPAGVGRPDPEPDPPSVGTDAMNIC